MRTTKRMAQILAAVSAIAIAPSALAQLGSPVNSTTQTVALTASMAQSLTITATPATASFTLVPGATADATAAVAITTTWSLPTNAQTVELDGYFSSATAALTDGASHNIPSSHVLGRVPSGTPTSFTAFTQSASLGTASAGLQLFTQTLTSSTYSSTRTDNLTLRIDLTAQPTLPAATYTGSLVLQAQAL